MDNYVKGTPYDVELVIDKRALSRFVKHVLESGSDSLVKWLATTRGHYNDKTPVATLHIESSTEFDTIQEELKSMLRRISLATFQLTVFAQNPPDDHFVETFGSEFETGEYTLKMKCADEYEALLWMDASNHRRACLLNNVLNNREAWSPLNDASRMGLEVMLLHPESLNSVKGLLSTLRAVEDVVPDNHRIYESEIEKLASPMIDMKILLSNRLQYLTLTQSFPKAIVKVADPDDYYPDVTISFEYESDGIAKVKVLPVANESNGNKGHGWMTTSLQLEPEVGGAHVHVPGYLAKDGEADNQFALTAGEYIYVRIADIDYIAKVSSEGIILDAYDSLDEDEALQSLAISFDQLYPDFDPDGLTP